jgi:AcrR family transcriptional regulator
MAVKTKEKILKCAYILFYREGFARVSVDAIAEASGVTKKTVYYHFESKDQIVADVLDHQHAYTLQRIHSWAGPEIKKPLEFVEALFARLALWTSEPNWRGSGFTRITMELADLPGHPARGAASRHKDAVESWLEERFVELDVYEANAKARQIMLLIEGCISLILIHGKKDYADQALCAAKILMGAMDK